MRTTKDTKNTKMGARFVVFLRALGWLRRTGTPARPLAWTLVSPDGQECAGVPVLRWLRLTAAAVYWRPL